MKKSRFLVLALFIGSLIIPALVFALTRTSTPAAAQQLGDCPPPEVIEAQRELLQNLSGEFIAIRAYKDATLNELGRQDATYYSLRAVLLRSLIERELLILEKRDILSGAEDGLSAEEQTRLVEIEDRLVELAVLLEGTNDSLGEQLDLVQVLWRPVIDLIRGISVERYERYTQRILEVDAGEGQDALGFAGEVLNGMLACAGEEAIPTIAPPTPRPSGVG